MKQHVRAGVATPLLCPAKRGHVACSGGSCGDCVQERSKPQEPQEPQEPPLTPKTLNVRAARPSDPLGLSPSMAVLVEGLQRLHASHAHYSEAVSHAHVREGRMALSFSGTPTRHTSVAIVVADTSTFYNSLCNEQGNTTLYCLKYKDSEPLHPHVCPAASRLVAMYLGIARPAAMEVDDLANLRLASLWVAIKLHMYWHPRAKEMVRCFRTSSLLGWVTQPTWRTLLKAEENLLATVGWRLHPPLAVDVAEHLVAATGLPACASSWVSASLALVAGDVELAVVRDPVLVGAAAVHLCIDRGTPRPNLRWCLERVLTDVGVGVALDELPATVAALRSAMDRA